MIKTITAITQVLNTQVLNSSNFTDPQIYEQLKNQIKELVDSKTPVTRDLLEQWLSVLVNQLADKSNLIKDVTYWWENT